MAAPTTQLAYEDFMRQVAENAGFGRKASTSEGLTSSQETWCDDIVQSGIRRVYNAHDWRFFRPVRSITAWATATIDASDLTLDYDTSDGQTTITGPSGSFHASMVGHAVTFDTNEYTIAAYTDSATIVVTGDAADETEGLTITADGDYRLPDDFGGFAGPVTFGAQTTYPPMRMTGEYEIRNERQRVSSETGRPWKAAMQPVESDGSAHQKWNLMLWPTPEQDYTLYYATYVQPNKLDATYKYPLGPGSMSELYQESCLAVLEERTKDPDRTHRELFQALLATAIKTDQRTAPDTLGYNADGGDTYTRYRHGIANVTVNGVEYS